MQQTHSDSKALRDGFKYVVTVGGVRKCYTTSLAEAKREAGRNGRIVALARLSYKVNPSSGAKQRARGTRDFKNKDMSKYARNVLGAANARGRLSLGLGNADYIPMGKESYLEAHKWYLADARKARKQTKRLPNPDGNYKIVRTFYKSGRRKVIHKNVSLAVAQAHCKDPRTRKAGVYFDGYESMSKKRNPAGRPPKQFYYADSVSGEQMKFGIKSAGYKAITTGALAKLRRLKKGGTFNLIQHQVRAQIKRVNPASEYNHHDARELYLYAINDGRIYKQTTLPVIAMLKKYLKRGKWDKAKAVVAFGYVADAAAKKYNKEFGSGPSFGGFTAATRRGVAASLLDHYIEAIQA